MNLDKHLHIAVIESDPLRFVGFNALMEAESDFKLICSSTAAHLDRLQNIDVALIGRRSGENLFLQVARLKAARSNLRIIATGSGMREDDIVKVLASGATGYVDEAASPTEFVRAIRVVSQGSVWASRRVLSRFVDHATRPAFHSCGAIFTPREKEVLEMLVEGKSNKEIGAPLGIEVRTVKAHVSRLMRKVGVGNRIALSTYAIANSLVSSR